MKRKTVSGQLWPAFFLALLVLALPVALLPTNILSFAQWLVLLIGALIVATLIFTRAVRRIEDFLREVKGAVQRAGDGDLGEPLRRARRDDFLGLARATNKMMHRTHQRVKTLIEEQRGQRAVLSSMREGVIVLDLNERVVRVNEAAAQILGIKISDAGGRSIQELVRNVDLLRFVKQSLANFAPVEGTAMLYGSEERLLQTYGRKLFASDGEPIGILVVLNDITKLHRLENVRRDFVANVSHELKTPITSIKGFVETLLNGALEQPEDARRFLGIVARHTDRLNAIFDDLLSLSRIEQGVEQHNIEFEEGRVSEVIRAAHQLCEKKAAEKGIQLTCEVAFDAIIRLNRILLEQAVVNLIDNAIKFSDAGKAVVVKSSEDGENLVITVEDNGCGIEKPHLERLFERFYRVDRARSRKVGGTGLGLAIVKHIAQAHGGHVDVASTPGQGSQFRIFIPLVRDAVENPTVSH